MHSPCSPRLSTVVIITLLCSCAESPTNEVPTELSDWTPLNTTVAVMNDMTNAWYVDARRQFQIVDGCRLKVTTGGFFGKDAAEFPLEQTRARIDGPDEQRTYRVVLTSASDASALEVVLDKAPFFDAHRMNWLIQHARAICRDE